MDYGSKTSFMNGYGHNAAVGAAAALEDENGNAGMDSITAASMPAPPPTTTTSYQGIINSMATLSNIGNSCYLNSVVYTLRFTPNFLHNLHHLVDDLNYLSQWHQNGVRKAKTASLGRNQSGIHSFANGQLNGGVGASGSGSSNSSRSMSNKDLVAMANGINGGYVANGHLLNGLEGSRHQLKCNRQTATEKLHELYQNLARNENVHHLDPYQPVQLLNAIQDVSSTFEGNQQQDAHEFLMTILDSIRETCQTLNKSFAENNEFQRTLNGVAQMACHDAPSNLSTAQIIASNSNSSTNNNNNGSGGSSAAAPFKSIFNLKRKSKRKEEKLAGAQLPPTGLKHSTNNSSSATNAKVPDILIDPTISLKPTLGTPTEKDSPQSLPTDESLVSSGGPPDRESGGEKTSKLDSDFFTEDFEGVTVSTTKCLSCETETEQKETMIDIAIPISGHESLEALDNPQSFFQSSCITKEYFRGDNKYRCEKCSAYTEAIRSISFEVLPRLLVVQLKRFSGGMEKINSFIPTPFVLQCFCRKCFALPEEKKLHVYRLYSVITHVGATMSAGHYITYTSSLDCYCDYLDCEKEAEKWAKLNGSPVVGATSSSSPSSLVIDNSGASGTSNGMDYDLTDGKPNGLTNLSNPGHNGQHEKMGSNLIDKIKKNRLFKNKSSASASSGLRAKFSLGGGSSSSSSNVQESIVNSQNELLERQQLMGEGLACGGVAPTAAVVVSRKQIGVGGYQPQVCRSMNCCTIKAKGSFLMKQVVSCSESRANAVSGETAADWNLYCNNARHQSKFGGGGSECGDPGATVLEGAALTASMSSSSSSATSGSLKHAQMNGAVSVQNGVAGGRSTRAMTAAAVANISEEPIWYMCDDDKIKSMPQHEFKELLSSNRKIAITPYLLFYARSDV